MAPGVELLGDLGVLGQQGGAVDLGELHHAHVLKCGPRSWRTKVHTDLRTEAPAQ